MSKNNLFLYFFIGFVFFSCNKMPSSKNTVAKYFDVKTIQDTFKILYATNCSSLNFQNMTYILEKENNSVDTFYNGNDVVLTTVPDYKIVDKVCQNLSDSIRIAMIKELIFVHFLSTTLYHYKNPFSDKFEAITSRAVVTKYIDYIYWGNDIHKHVSIYPDNNLINHSFTTYQQFYTALYYIGSIEKAIKKGIHPPK